jgi:hypothetical protein
MPSVPLDAADAIELAELLCFLGDWLESDRGNLTGSLARFTGSTAYGPPRCARTSPASSSSSERPADRACSARTSRNYQRYGSPVPWRPGRLASRPWRTMPT